MTYLLDTETCIDLLRGRESTIRHAGELGPAELSISEITRYELLYPVELCPPEWRPKERGKVKLLVEHLEVLPFTADTAARAAQLRAEQDALGQRIGPMDMLIAATALVHSLVVITNSDSDFQRVWGLRCVSWSV